uniref:Uncharacterized protein n=1 Tax=Romanomermis culicivorax TaxID=13658 RepID=A0A915IAT2_ROMCU
MTIKKVLIIPRCGMANLWIEEKSGYRWLEMKHRKEFGTFPDTPPNHPGPPVLTRAPSATKQGFQKSTLYRSHMVSRCI